MDTELCTAWIRECDRVVRRDVERLTRLDTAIGDGDHGANLRRGFEAALSALDDKRQETPGAVLTVTGGGLVSKTGGASGPLYGTVFRRAGKALGDDEQVDAAALGTALRAGLDGVTQLGSAAEGDKTMVDALTPAVAAYERVAAEGAEQVAAARAAADAAESGAEATVPLQARKGRASYLAERSVGHLDPGAASAALILRALADVLSGPAGASAGAGT